MRLFTSNRLEQLQKLLAALVSRPLPPLQTEVILVQSQGMAHWLSMGLSQQLGIWANAKFPFPLAFLRDVQKACNIHQDSRAWSPESLPWSTWQALEQLQDHPAFTILNNYLHNNQSPESRWQLARRIANSFDEYMIYRPELLLEWDTGTEPDNWQAVLWRALNHDIKTPHRAQLQQQILNALKAGQIDKQRLPSRLSIFGISSLPPIYIEILNQLSRYIEINILLMNPCEIYWGDILNDYELAHQRLKQAHTDDNDLHLAPSNAILASLGRLGRDFLELLDPYDLPNMSAFKANQDTHLLAHIQNDILNLEQNPDNSTISATDTSIQLHNCHSPMREIEILYDQLLALFEQQPQLNPSDILVMTPDIETYTPLIQSVFNNNDKTRLPYSIADKSQRSEGILFDSFIQLLSLPDSRLSISQVLSLLETPAIQARFNISDTDLEQINSWLKTAHIRWGIDSETRTKLKLPNFEEYSWKQGLDRLLLGYAQPDHSEQMQDYQNILPLDLIEGQNSLIFGKLLNYTDKLFQHFNGLNSPRSSGDWLNYLEQMLNDFYQNDDSTQDDLQQLRQGLQQLHEQQQQAQFEQKIPINIIATWFEQHLNQQLPAQGFMTGKVTFCALLPMRSIPFKVICLLGMNDRDFPRNFRAPSFDLIAAQPRKGDRSRRHDDRYLFLEALLSARQTFYVSYIGQDIKDNKPRQASTVVSVLQQYIQTHWSDDILKQIQQQHALQAFHPSYFEPQSPYFSYRKHICIAAQALQNLHKTQIQFIQQKLNIPTENHIQLSQIQQFYKNPSRHFLQHSLRLQTRLSDEQQQDQEPLEMDDLSNFYLKEQLLKRSLQNQQESHIQRWAYIDGKLPPAALSQNAYQDNKNTIEPLYQRIKEKTQQNSLPILNKSLQIDHIQLSATIDHIYPSGLLRYHPSKSKLKHLLNAWLEHLFLNATAPDNYPKQTHILFEDKSWTLQATPDSQIQLQNLIQHFYNGQQYPIAYFPNSCDSYWQMRYLKNKSQDEALKKAQQIWANNTKYNQAERQESPHLRCFEKQPLEGKLGQDFIQTCEAILEPLAISLGIRE